jgi:methylaspartate ammonia-lyase
LCEQVVVPRLLDLPLSSFRGACDCILAPRENGERLPLSVEYGVSQALLALFAMLGNKTMTETISSEFNCKIVLNPVPIYAQSGDDRFNGVDKMILKNVDILPHGLINAASKFGQYGEIFLNYVEWVARRVQTIGGDRYRPKLHFDLYGMIGLTFGLDPTAIASFIARAASRAAPFNLHIESPADFGSRQGQIDGSCAILDQLSARGCDAKVVADEWCNTLSDIKAFADVGAADIVQIKMPDVGSIADSAAAVLYCKGKGTGAYLGGSCSETDTSARTSVHIAIATGADMLLAKPGMGVDEGVSIVGNEQSRILADLRYKARKPL